MALLPLFGRSQTSRLVPILVEVSNKLVVLASLKLGQQLSHCPLHFGEFL